jgi:hypothetical protein
MRREFQWTGNRVSIRKEIKTNKDQKDRAVNQAKGEVNGLSAR